MSEHQVHRDEAAVARMTYENFGRLLTAILNQLHSLITFGGVASIPRYT